ncbi:SDR family NAD(P)-dependent oxidoreductase [Mesobacillus maritimus]|uniref:SDR family NAD(P)-dependent oxidoreductase n=1 Tax=Mesobacillus maritimus TaxID=1643336 RepID=UPI003850619F
MSTDQWDMSGNVCMITGANAGIGKRAANQLAKLGAKVIIVCRNMTSGTKAAEEIVNETNNKNIQVLQADLSSQDSIRTLVENFRQEYDQLDVLIHNAANFDLSMKEPILTEDGVEAIFATNHLGPFLLTNLLLDLLKKSRGRVITIASKGLIAYPNLLIEFDNLNGEQKYSPTKAYYQSKMAQLMFTYHAAELFQGTGVTFNCIRVPAVQVNLGRHENVPALMKYAYKLKRKFSIPPEVMAQTYTYLAANPSLSETTGKYFDENQSIVSSSKKSYDREVWSKLWDISNQLTHIDQW